MKVIIFGTTGMVGQGVLRECELAPRVTHILSVVRRASGLKHTKLEEIVHDDFFNFSALADKMAGYDACFFCLGVSSVGMKENEYSHLTYDLTLAAAKVMAPRNPGLTFIYVSGAGGDRSEKGPRMWARVKGKTENALAALPFKAVYFFRPGYIQPGPGIKSKTTWYRVLYALVSPAYPVFKAVTPGLVTSTERVGRAMIRAASHGAPKAELENRDINDLADAT